MWGCTLRTRWRSARSIANAALGAFVARARDLGLTAERTSYNAWSKGASVRDPEGRLVEVLVNDLAVFWTNE
jgi:hypothetical protein